MHFRRLISRPIGFCIGGGKVGYQEEDGCMDSYEGILECMVGITWADGIGIGIGWVALN